MNNQSNHIPIEGDMYRVVWEIDIGASSYEEAAKLAREIQLDKNSSATIFDVTNIDANIVRTIDTGEC